MNHSWTNASRYYSFGKIWILLSKIYFYIRQRFLDLCEKKVPWGSLTMMKDISLSKKGAVGEHLYYKVQDFVYDSVLFEYCRHPTVNTI